MTLMSWIRVRVLGVANPSNAEIVGKIKMAQSDLHNAKVDLSHEVKAMEIRSKKSTTAITKLLDETISMVNKKR